MPPQKIQLHIVTVWIVAHIAITTGRKGAIWESRLENFYQCPNHKNTTFSFHDTYVKRISSSSRRLFGKMVLQKDIPDIKGKMQMYKCASKSEPDTCEYYTSIVYQSLCFFLVNKKEPWYSYFASSNIPIKCPLAKGTWEIKGTKMGLTESFPLLSGFWRLKNQGYDANNKLISCFFTEMTIFAHFGDGSLEDRCRTLFNLFATMEVQIHLQSLTSWFRFISFLLGFQDVMRFHPTYH